MNIARKLLTTASQRLELPAEITAGLPKMELTGTTEFSVEPHKGLLEYEQQRISVASSIGAIHVNGRHMTIKLMNQERITVVGEIQSVELPGDRHE